MRVRPHGLVWRCGKAVESVLLWGLPSGLFMFSLCHRVGERFPH